MSREGPASGQNTNILYIYIYTRDYIWLCLGCVILISNSCITITDQGHVSGVLCFNKITSLYITVSVVQWLACLTTIPEVLGPISSCTLEIFLEISDLELGLLTLMRTIVQQLDMRSSEIRLRKLKLRLRVKHFANHKAPMSCCLAATASVSFGSLELQYHGFNLVGQVAQMARHLAMTGWPGFDPGCWRGGDFYSLLRVQPGPGVYSTFYKMSTGTLPWDKGSRAYSPSHVSLYPKGET